MIRSSKFCYRLLKKILFGCLGAMCRDRHPLWRTMSHGQPLANCKTTFLSLSLFSISRSLLCLTPTHFCQPVTRNINPTPGPCSSLSGTQFYGGWNRSGFPAQLPFPLLSVSILHSTTAIRKAVWYWEKENMKDPEIEDWGFSPRIIINGETGQVTKAHWNLGFTFCKMGIVIFTSQDATKKANERMKVNIMLNYKQRKRKEGRRKNWNDLPPSPFHTSR